MSVKDKRIPKSQLENLTVVELKAIAKLNNVSLININKIKKYLTAENISLAAKQSTSNWIKIAKTYKIPISYTKKDLVALLVKKNVKTKKTTFAQGMSVKELRYAGKVYGVKYNTTDRKANMAEKLNAHFGKKEPTLPLLSGGKTKKQLQKLSKINGLKVDSKLKKDDFALKLEEKLVNLKKSNTAIILPEFNTLPELILPNLTHGVVILSRFGGKNPPKMFNFIVSNTYGPNRIAIQILPLVTGDKLRISARLLPKHIDGLYKLIKKPSDTEWKLLRSIANNRRRFLFDVDIDMVKKSIESGLPMKFSKSTRKSVTSSPEKKTKIQHMVRRALEENDGASYSTIKKYIKRTFDEDVTIESIMDMIKYMKKLGEVSFMSPVSMQDMVASAFRGEYAYGEKLSSDDIRAHIFSVYGESISKEDMEKFLTTNKYRKYKLQWMLPKSKNPNPSKKSKSSKKNKQINK